MPLDPSGRIWRKSKTNGGVAYPQTLESFASQSELDARVNEYRKEIWRPRHQPDGAKMTHEKALALERKALVILKDRLEDVLISRVLNRVHHSQSTSSLSLDELIDSIMKMGESFYTGESLVMEVDGQILTHCKVISMINNLYNVLNDEGVEVIGVNAKHLRRTVPLTQVDARFLVLLTCSQHKTGKPWLVDDALKKELGVKDKLAPIFCSPRVQKIKGDSDEEDIVLLKTPDRNKKPEKVKRESSDSLKENNGRGKKKENRVSTKKEVERKNKKEGEDTEKGKRGRKRKRDQNGTVNEVKSEKKEKKEKQEKKKVETETIVLDSSDEDNVSLAAVAKKAREEKKRQKEQKKHGGLDKYIVEMNGESSSPTKNATNWKELRVEKTLNKLREAYAAKESNIMATIQMSITSLSEEDIIKASDKAKEDDKEEEFELFRAVFLKMRQAKERGLIMGAPSDKRKELRDELAKNMENDPDKVHLQSVTKKIRQAAHAREVAKTKMEDECGYPSSLGDLAPFGHLIHDPLFPDALMISAFVFTRSTKFPKEYRIPMTDDILEAIRAPDENKARLAKNVTIPLVHFLLGRILESEKYYLRFFFCDDSVMKLELNEWTMMELMRVLVTGEKPSTKADRDRIRDGRSVSLEPKKKVKSKKESESDEESSEEDENEEEEDRTKHDDSRGEEEGEDEIDELDVTLVDSDSRDRLVNAIDAASPFFYRMDDKSQIEIMQLLMQCYLDIDRPTPAGQTELMHTKQKLKQKKADLKNKLEQCRNEKEVEEEKLKGRDEGRIRTTRLRQETAMIDDLEKKIGKYERSLEEVEDELQDIRTEEAMEEYACRVNPMGSDRHGRMYSLMPQAEGLYIQSMGSLQWNKQGDSHNFVFIDEKERWWKIDTEEEWNRLNTVLKEGSRCEKSLSKTMDGRKERFMDGLEWAKTVAENREKEKEKEEEKNDEDENVESILSICLSKLSELVERAENEELLTVKLVRAMMKEVKEVEDLEQLKRCILSFVERMLESTGVPGRKANVLTLFAGFNEIKLSFFSYNIFQKRLKDTSRVSEVYLLLFVMESRLCWGKMKKRREKEMAKNKVEEKEEEEDDDDDLPRISRYRTRNMDNKEALSVARDEKKKVNELVKKVKEAAAGRLYSTLCTMEVEDGMNLKEIEDISHKLNMERLKRQLRQQIPFWREHIEERISHRIEQFDQFYDAIHNLLN